MAVPSILERGNIYVARGDAVALVVDQYLHLAIQHDTDTASFISRER